MMPTCACCVYGYIERTTNSRFHAIRQEEKVSRGLSRLESDGRWSDLEITNLHTKSTDAQYVRLLARKIIISPQGIFSL